MLRTATDLPVVYVDVIGFAVLRPVAYFRRFVLVFGLLPVFSQAATEKTYYYVSPAGSDSAPSTREAPWKTLQHAADTAPVHSVVRVMAGDVGIPHGRFRVLHSGGSSAKMAFELPIHVIRGWAQYHQHGASKRTFTKVDHDIFTVLWQWAKRRHPMKSRRWIKETYFRSDNGNHWRFVANASPS